MYELHVIKEEEGKGEEKKEEGEKIEKFTSSSRERERRVGGEGIFFPSPLFLTLSHRREEEDAQASQL